METDKRDLTKSWTGPAGSLGGFGIDEFEREEGGREWSLLRPLEARRRQGGRFIADNDPATASDRAALASEGVTDEEMLEVRRTLPPEAGAVGGGKG